MRKKMISDLQLFLENSPHLVPRVVDVVVSNVGRGVSNQVVVVLRMMVLMTYQVHRVVVVHRFACVEHSFLLRL